MTPALQAFFEAYKQRFEPALDNLLNPFHSPYSENGNQPLLETLRQAMRYSLLDGGKRIRPGRNNAPCAS